MSNIVLESLSLSNPLRRELFDGELYRNFKKNMVMPPLCPVRSPIDISAMINKKKPKTDVKSKSAPCEGCSRKKSKSVPQIKNSFWERAKLSHKQYTEVLSTPQLHSLDCEDDKRKYRSKTAQNICSPRLIQMSCPSKRRILGTWQEHGDHLSVDAIHRLHDLLYTSKTIDMKDARNYFKMYDRKKRRQQRKLELKKKRRKNKNKVQFLKAEIEKTSTAILDYFSQEPSLYLSFKQLMLSDALIIILTKAMKREQPILRYTSNLYSKQIVKTVDKMAVWIDSISKIVEMQSLEEEEHEGTKVPEELASTIASTLSFSDVRPDDTEEKGGGDLGGDDFVSELGADGEVFDETGKAGQAEGVEGVSSLQRLIQILANASSAYLSGTVEDLQNVTRNELLNKIKVLQKDYGAVVTPAQLLTKILLDWAMHNNPSKIDLHMIKKIEKVAEMLAAMLLAEDVYGMTIAPEAAKRDIAKDIPSERSARSGLPTSVQGQAASEVMEVMDYGEDEPPLPGTLTEVIAPDGSVQMGVVDEDGQVMPVQLTPSGNLLPTVYDKKAKVVDKLFDPEENLLDVTFNKYGVPEPNTYNGDLYDDEKYAHELIYNDKGRIIPQCYDKDGNPIAAAYDDDGNPLYFGPDGKPIEVPEGGSARIVDGKLVITDKDGVEIREDSEERESPDVDAEEVEDQEEGDAEQTIGEEIGGAEESEGEEDVGEEIEGEDVEGEEDEGEEDEGEEDEGQEAVEEEEEEEEAGESSEVVESELGEDIEKMEKDEPAAAVSRDSMITVIKGHKPKKVYEHTDNTICCLSLKIWAVWLLDITHNAHNWTKWISNIIGQIREFAAILRGEVLLPNGQKQVIFKEDWNKFVEKMNEDVIAWRQYNRHVKDLTEKIVNKFHGKKVRCCEKCLEDHLIKNVVAAHDTLRALTEALNCAGYWQRCLDEIVQATSNLAVVKPTEHSTSESETGWSHSSSDGDDKDEPYCYKMMKSKRHSTAKIQQIFPRINPSYSQGVTCQCAALKTRTKKYCI